MKWQLSAHARQRIKERLRQHPDLTLAIRVPTLPSGVTIIGSAARSQRYIATATALCPVRGETVTTTIALSEGLLAALLVRLMTQIWVIDLEDGVSIVRQSRRGHKRKGPSERRPTTRHRSKELRLVDDGE